MGKSNTEKRVELFLTELTALTKKYEIEITGSDSYCWPWLEDLQELDGRYEANADIFYLKWKPTEEANNETSI